MQDIYLIKGQNKKSAYKLRKNNVLQKILTW